MQWSLVPHGHGALDCRDFEREAALVHPLCLMSAPSESGDDMKEAREALYIYLLYIIYIYILLYKLFVE